METKVLNYRVVIEPEKMGRKTVYNAYCPTLAVADYGDTIEDVLKSIQDGIELAVECLVDEGQEIPVDNVIDQLITTTQIKAPPHAKLSYV